MLDSLSGIQRGVKDLPEAKPKDDPEKTFEAARQFESILLAQMMKSMRSADSSGWLGTGEDATTSSVMEMAEEQFSKTIAAQGGLGLATMVVSGLKESRPAPTPASK